VLHKPPFLPFPCPSSLSRSLFTTVCFCLPNLGPFTHVTLFFFPSYPCGVYRPRGALCRKSSAEDRTGRECCKRKWQFLDERTETPREDATAYPLTPWTYESLYTRVHTPLARRNTKIFCGLPIFLSLLSATSVD